MQRVSNRVSVSVAKNIIPPGTGHRPITQQGVSGIQTSQRTRIGCNLIFYILY